MAIEYLTKWIEAKIVKANITKHVAKFFYEQIITKFGCQNILIIDRSKYFLNEVIEDFTSRLKIDHRKTNSYHLQTNGHIKRIN